MNEFLTTMKLSLISWVLLTIVSYIKSAAIYEPACPVDCICYPDYLSNLASWKWIESKVDTTVDINDPDHEEFNPYTEHNEVYENPNSKRYQNEEPLKTVTCIIRNGSAESVSKMFREIPEDTQILSVLQAAGAGSIKIEEKFFENLRGLIGVQFQGHKSFQERPASRRTFKLGPDALDHLDKLTYLSLENVVIQERELENHISDTDYIISKIVRFSHSGNTTRIISNALDEDENHMENIIQSQLVFMDLTESNDDSVILPYSAYKQKREKLLMESKKHPTPLEPKLKVAFTNIPTLLQLRISECNLEGLSWDMFYKLSNLIFLILERNDLLFLPDFVFYATPNLTALSLAENRILNLQTVGLAGLLQLQKLDVTSNNITYLSELSLPPFPHLEVADFRHNPIETIFPNTFEVMNTTKTLYIGSPLKPIEFHPNSFYGLVALTKLEISNVKIEFLERPMLKGMPQLKLLTMNGKITRISFDAFNEVPKLEKLVLKQSAIKKISMDAFYGLASLQELDLSHNLLTFLPPGLLDEQVRLKEIYLQHNQLVTLPQNLFLKSPLQIIRLDENQWHCSCDMVTWNSTIINQVKRYELVRNHTQCQKQYDKGSCPPEHIKIQPKYVYEKRVSPVCSTPSKFSQRSVFTVIRKELKYCSRPTVRIEALTNSTEANTGRDILIKLTNSTSKFTIVKTKEQMEKQREKEAYFAGLNSLKPSKVKKPQVINSLSVEALEILTNSATNQSIPTKASTTEPPTPHHEIQESVTDSSTTLLGPSTTPSTQTTTEAETSMHRTTEMPSSTTQMLTVLSTEPPEEISNTISTKSSGQGFDESIENSALTVQYQRIKEYQAALDEEHENNKIKSPKWPFQQSKPKIPKISKPAKTDSTSTVSKQAIKLARIQRKLAKKW